MKEKITIVILDFMKAKRVLKNVSFLISQKADFFFKIIVIDNSCNKKNARILKDGLKKYQNLNLIINEKNSGYIKAHNEAIKKSKGEFIAIINPDVLLRSEDSLQKMIDFLEKNENIGILGPKQVNDNGEIAMSARAFPKLYLQIARRTFLRRFPFFKKKVLSDEMRFMDYSKNQDVDWLQSSCMLIRRKLWEEIGGFNEKYFLFMADVELCFEAWKAGYRTVFFADTQVYADGKRLSEGGFFKFFKSWILRQHLIDSLLYRIKYIFQKNPRQEYYKNKKKYEQD